MALTLGRYGENMDSYYALRDCRVLVNEEMPDCGINPLPFDPALS